MFAQTAESPAYREEPENLGQAQKKFAMRFSICYISEIFCACRIGKP